MKKYASAKPRGVIRWNGVSRTVVAVAVAMVRHFMMVAVVFVVVLHMPMGNPMVAIMMSIMMSVKTVKMKTTDMHPVIMTSSLKLFHMVRPSCCLRRRHARERYCAVIARLMMPDTRACEIDQTTRSDNEPDNFPCHRFPFP